MYFPLGDDQVKGGYYPIFSYGFLALNIIVFLFEKSLPPGQIELFIQEYGSIPAETARGEDLFSLLTSIFLHGGWSHLIFNMLFLWIFADNIEATIGNFHFLFFYLLAGLVAHAAHFYFNMNSGVPTVGASGAISGVMGAYLVMFPTSRIRMYIFPVFLIRVPAILFLGFWIALQLMNVTTSPAVDTLQADSGVAWWAHIGGFIFGVIAGFYFRFNYPQPELEP